MPVAAQITAAAPMMLQIPTTTKNARTPLPFRCGSRSYFPWRTLSKAGQPVQFCSCIVPMDWKDLKRTREPTEGEWHPVHTIGLGITDWSLKCGAFRADIRQKEGWGCELAINKHPYMHKADLDDCMRRAEEVIIQRIDAVLPAYDIIKARLAARPPSRG